jgi:hypothetical protein
MVGLAIGVVAIIATGGAATPAVIAGAEMGAYAGMGGAVAGTAAVVTTTTAVSGAAAVGGTAGMIAGAGAAASGAAAASGTAVAVGAGAGAVGGGMTGAAVSSVAAGIFTGPIGWTILGATETESPGIYTFDCWKSVLHDDSCEPSNGRILRDVVLDSRIKRVTAAIDNKDNDLPELILQNIWDEQFRIEYVILPPNQLAAHAVRI